MTKHRFIKKGLRYSDRNSISNRFLKTKTRSFHWLWKISHQSKNRESIVQPLSDVNTFPISAVLWIEKRQSVKPAFLLTSSVNCAGELAFMPYVRLDAFIDMDEG